MCIVTGAQSYTFACLNGGMLLCARISFLMLIGSKIEFLGLCHGAAANVRSGREGSLEPQWGCVEGGGLRALKDNVLTGKKTGKVPVK